MAQNRKDFIVKTGAGILMTGIPGWLSANENPDDQSALSDFIEGGAPDDEKYWKNIAKKYYHVAGDYINLENGYYGLQSKPVLNAYLKNIEFVNKDSVRFARRVFPDKSKEIKKELAAFLNVDDEEIIITRNATEALNIAIQGYPFNDGDEVVINQLDYFSMIEAFRMLEKRGNIRVASFEMPLLPKNEDEIVDIYASMITQKTRVILLTHVSNINGLIVPVSKISAMAKQKGIDVICDSAHALGQIEYSIKELGTDFIGMNLHKWIGNPIGAGVLYVKKDRIADLKPMFGDYANADDNINKLAHFGTTPFAVIMTIPDSITFHKLIGTEKKSARLHYLKKLWVDQLNQMPGVEVVTPVDKNLSCGIASFRMKNKKTAEMVDYLFKGKNILTTGRALGTTGCIRVTPSIYNSSDDILNFVKAVQQG